MQIRRWATVIGILLAFCNSAAAQGKAKAAEPITQKLTVVDIQVAADGSTVQTLHAELTAGNDASAMQISQLSFPYDATMQDLQIVEAHTLKPDGSTIPVDASAIYDQLAAGQSSAPMFTGYRAKVVVFPRFAAGDTAVYTVKITTKHPFFDGEFFYGELFLPTMAYDEVRETITAPKSMPLYVENHDVDFSKRETATNVIYTWHYSAPRPKTDDEYVAVSPIDHVARFFVSSFKDYAALGRAYAALSVPKETVTPKIAALADQIASGVNDRRMQTQKLYEWVTRHIRYVAVELGKGSFVPHDPDSVIENGYGDCKDHDVLLQALLKAKGIAAESVLINSDNAYTLTQVPTFTQLNHVITYVPEFKLYLDSSAVVAPFGVLPNGEYGKPIVTVSASGATLGTMPVLPAGVASVTTTTVEHLSKDGQLSGTTTTMATGPYSIALRYFGLGIQTLGPANAASKMLTAMGYKGASGDFSEDSPVEPSPTYAITGNFSVSGWSDEASGSSSFYLPGGLRLFGLTGDGIMGPFDPGQMKDTEPTACFSGHASETLTLQPPSGMQFSDVPKDTRIETPNLLFVAHWSLANGALSVRREFTSKIDQPLCTGELRKRTAAALKQIADSYNTELSLVPSGTAPAAAVPSGADAAANGQNDETFRTATAAMNGHDLDTAIKLLSTLMAQPNLAPQQSYMYHDARGTAYLENNQSAEAIDDLSVAIRLKPDSEAQPYLARGSAYLRLNKPELAMLDFDVAVRLEPDNWGAHMARAEMLEHEKQYDEAILDFNAALKIRPKNLRTLSERALANQLNGDFDEAAADFERIGRLKGSESSVLGQLCETLSRSSKPDMAVYQCSRVLALTPYDGTALQARGIANFRLGKYADALRDFDQAARTYPTDADYLYERGTARIKTGDSKGGQADIAAAKLASPGVARKMAARKIVP